MGTRHRAVIGLFCVTLILVVAGCAARGSGSSAAPGGSMSDTPSTPPVSAPTPSPSAGTGANLVLTGQVEAGVEPGCLILKDAGQTYQLTGGDPAIVKAGARVRVTGHLAVGQMSYCMQGQPFQVTEAHAL